MVYWERVPYGFGCETGECGAIGLISVTLRPLHDPSVLTADDAAYFHSS